MIEIEIIEYYNRPEYYRFMSNDLFSALEFSYINGNSTAKVLDQDFSRMILLKEINEQYQIQ